MLSTLRSLWSWFAITLIMAVAVPMVFVTRRFDRDPAHYTTGRVFRFMGSLMSRVNLDWKVRFFGTFPENPRHPYVVVCNHLSMADIPVVSRLPWEMKWVAKKALFTTPLLGVMMRMVGDIPVDRTDRRSGVQVMIKAREYLKNNCSVIFFPEGTRSLTGQTLPFTDGAFRLAIKAGVPILPLVLDGSQDALPKHSWRFGSARDIRLEVLPPVSTEGLKPADTAALREQVRGQIMQRLAEWRGTTLEAVDSQQGPALKAGAVKSEAEPASNPVGLENTSKTTSGAV